MYPFREAGLIVSDIVRILEESGVGMPTFTRWGRTRSGCYFCFFQQKIEVVRLKETHPDLFDQAKQYEYANRQNGNPFYWNGKEPLAELEKPERMDEIKRNWELAQKKRKGNSDKLVHILGNVEPEDEEESACLICRL